MVNVKIIEDGLRAAMLDPEHHEQETWGGFPFEQAKKLYEKISYTPGAQLSGPERYVPVSCGTSKCLAGRIALDNGYTFVISPEALYSFINWGNEAGTEAENASVSNVIPTELIGPDGKVSEGMRYAYLSSARTVAKTLAELTEEQADSLFSSMNVSWLHLWTTAYAVTDGEISLPESLPECASHPEITDVRGAVFAVLSSMSQVIDGRRGAYDMSVGVAGDLLNADTVRDFAMSGDWRKKLTASN